MSTKFFPGVVEDSRVPLERFDDQNTYYDDMGHFCNVVSSAKMFATSKFDDPFDVQADIWYLTNEMYNTV